LLSTRGSIQDGTLLHSRSQYTTVKHSQKLFEHTYTSDPHGLGKLTPIEFFQHDLLWQSLPFLQSESFQTHVGTIHRRAIGPLALQNGTSAYTSLTRHLPAPTIECLHRPPYKLTCSSHNFRYGLSLPTSKESAAKYTRPHPTDLQTRLYIRRSLKTIVTSVHGCVLNYSACLHCYLPSIVA
jgi:hypothetical protein